MRLPRNFGVLALALLVSACDPIVRVTLLLAPAAPRVRDLTATARDSAAPIATPVALEAVERVAAQFGLKRLPPDGCSHAWEGPGFSGHTHLSICATMLPNGDLRLWLSEGITRRWSARGDSLRRVLEDTLGQFGRVESVAAP
jgi:hypothetical protein